MLKILRSHGEVIAINPEKIISVTPADDSHSIIVMDKPNVSYMIDLPVRELIAYLDNKISTAVMNDIDIFDVLEFMCEHDIPVEYTDLIDPNKTFPPAEYIDALAGLEEPEDSGEELSDITEEE
jgi:hypothetical protein